MLKFLIVFRWYWRFFLNIVSIQVTIDTVLSKNIIKILIWYFSISIKIFFFILNTYLVDDILGENYVPSKYSLNIFTPMKLSRLADNQCVTVLLNLATAGTIRMPSKSFLFLFSFLGMDTKQTLTPPHTTSSSLPHCVSYHFWEAGESGAGGWCSINQ